MPSSHQTKPSERYVSAYISAYTINYMHFRNPWVVAWWSAAFPGLGHMMMNRYMIAFILIMWEFAVNYKAGINSAIYYSMTGQFERAIQSADKRWFLFYITAYLFSIWDGYKKAVQLNHDYMLSCADGFTVRSDNLSILERNNLGKRNPLMAILWSFLAPGLGHLYLSRLPSAVIFIVWFAVIIHFSHVLPAIHETMELHFAEAKADLNLHWFLNIPSIYIFVAYDAYVNTVEYNRLFKKEQAAYFKQEYQHAGYDMPL
ncbi:hypothetical protein [Paenibacillus nasutitermitis]|uniref:Uncharacterized protein n=1 Tax=Paenibacillus nasutitermitis TaxID=1652958 RepID=A0A917E2C3_9BACL|nr:hypothetical protein [Paenibacillus nasutitermitis]GGD93672.1 hypothetical protein GCM10010911_60410 [Paenibacillus nasutitermitis]